jgi:hypothetical protein
METLIKKGRPYNRRSLAIGNIRLRKLALKYQELGYKVLMNPSTSPDVDLIIITVPDGRIRKVIEVTNYARPDEKIDDVRFERYVNSLTYFEDIEGIELELVVSYLDNLTSTQIKELQRCNIHVNVMGKQDLLDDGNNKTILGWIESNE